MFLLSFLGISANISIDAKVVTFDKLCNRISKILIVYNCFTYL